MANIEQGPKRERQGNREELIRLFISLSRETIRITNEIISKALEELDPLRSQEDPHEAFSDFNDFMRLIKERVSKLDAAIKSVLKVKRLFPKDQALRDLAFELKQARLLLKGTVETLRAAFKQRIKEQRLRKLKQGMGKLIEFKELEEGSYFGRNGNSKDGDVKPESDGKNE